MCSRFFIPNVKPITKQLNYNAQPFFPNLILCIDTHVISVILVILIIITILILKILHIPKNQNADILAPKEHLRKLKFDNPNKLILGHLNINSIRNEFECLCAIIDNNIDILLLSETEIDDTFPDCQFIMNGFNPPFRKNRTDKGGGLMLFIKEHVSCRELNMNLELNIAAIFIEINLRKRKWLLIGGYNPDKNQISTFLNCIESKLNELCLKYENIILMGDLHSEMCEERMEIFCNTYNFKCLIKEPTCFKSIVNRALAVLTLY